MLVLAKPKLVARLLASDFPSENPRIQTRNFPYTKHVVYNFEMNNISRKLSQEILNGNDVSEILGNPKEFPTELIEKLSIQTATEYWNGKIDFDDGYCIMNNLQTFWVTNDYFFKNFGFGKIAWKCYEAFDSGGFLRPTDNSNIDPAEKYSKPLIEKLLLQLKIIK